MQAITQAKANHPQPQSPNKGSIRRVRLVMLILACFLCWAGVTVWNQVDKIDSREEKVGSLREKLAETERVQQNAQREIARLNDPEYVQQIIRKELQYVKEGETLFYTPQAAGK